MSDNTAILSGFTREVLVYTLGHERHCFVPASADLAGQFPAYDADECEFIKLAGWLCEVRDIACWAR